MTPEEIQIKIEQLKERKKFLLTQKEGVHQIKSENCTAAVHGEKGFIKLEIPKMQLMENLSLQVIGIDREIKALEQLLPITP